jgi:hypothetical protein
MTAAKPEQGLEGLRSKAAAIAAEHYMACTGECVSLTSAILRLVQAEVAAAQQKALDLYESDMQGYDFTPEDYEGDEDINVLIIDALKNSKKYVNQRLADLPHPPQQPPTEGGSE